MHHAEQRLGAPVPECAPASGPRPAAPENARPIVAPDGRRKLDDLMRTETESRRSGRECPASWHQDRRGAEGICDTGYRKTPEPGKPGRLKRPGQHPEMVVGVRGFEPPTPASRTQYSTRLSYTPNLDRPQTQTTRARCTCPPVNASASPRTTPIVANNPGTACAESPPEQRMQPALPPRPGAACSQARPSGVSPPARHRSR